MNYQFWKNKDKDTAMLQAKDVSVGVCPIMLKDIINKCKYMVVDKEEEFIHQGEPNNYIYILINGIASSTYCEGKKGIITQFFHPQRNILMFNSLGSHSGIITNEGFEGICKTSMLRLSKQVLEELIIQYPKLNTHISNNYNWQQHENRNHANTMQMHTAQEKIIYYYFTHPYLFNNCLITAIKQGKYLNVEISDKLTTLFRNKLTSAFRSKLTTPFRCKLTTC